MDYNCYNDRISTVILSLHSMRLYNYYPQDTAFGSVCLSVMSRSSSVVWFWIRILEVFFKKSKNWGQTTPGLRIPGFFWVWHGGQIPQRAAAYIDTNLNYCYMNIINNVWTFVYKPLIVLLSLLLYLEGHFYYFNYMGVLNSIYHSY